MKRAENNAESKIFYRYTNLSAAIDLLRKKRIRLLDPTSWDDKNDIFSIRTYKERKNAKTVLALCFAEGTEKYHYWKAFSNGPDGVCILFEKEKLLSAFRGDDKIEHRRVKYVPMREIEKSPPDVSDLPFLKRYPYRAEREYRVIYTDTGELIEPKDYPIDDLSCVKQIRLSPWMPSPLVDSVRKTLKDIPGCERLKIRRSTVVDSERWKSAVNRAN